MCLVSQQEKYWVHNQLQMKEFNLHSGTSEVLVSGAVL